jgi:hypothetical protein
VRRFKFTQEVAGADKVDAFVDDHPPTHDIAVLKQKQRFGFGIGAENPFQGFGCRGLTKPAGRTPLLQPALLIDPNFRRRDVHLVEMRVDPFDDRACSACCPDAGRLVEDGIRDARSSRSSSPAKAR